MFNDRWDISHIAIAVADLEQAMERYAAELGVEWSPILDIGSMDGSIYDMRGNDVSAGLCEVWSLRGHIDGSGPSLELACSAAGSPSQAIWGAPVGEDNLHHICYYVDDLVGETAHLVDHGYLREASLAPPDEPPEMMSYVVSPAGIRYELMQARDKAALTTWLQTGELVIDGT